MTWQPIASAPRDGTIIDGWMVLAKCHCPKCDEIYSVGSRIENIYWSSGQWNKHGGIVGNEVTHWMPRPEPPAGVSVR